jgi:hypothetical protein
MFVVQYHFLVGFTKHNKARDDHDSVLVGFIKLLKKIRTVKLDVFNLCFFLELSNDRLPTSFLFFDPTSYMTPITTFDSL